MKSRTTVRVALLGVVAVAMLGITACQPPPPKVEAHGGTGQIWVTTDPNVPVQLIDRHGAVVSTLTYDGTGPHANLTRTTDANGALVFRYITPDSGYRVRRTDTSAVQESGPVTVGTLTTAPPTSLYTSQKLTIGYGYMNMRDGQSLAYNIRLPGPIDKGPYPTVIEYSGYDPANPDNEQPSSEIARLLGFATVGVNLRGTGCSGGSFQLWENQQSTDGYDIVETVAAQPWVLSHKVGMVGISYPGITQLFAAQTQPPHLEAVAPLSVFDDSFRNLFKPGGLTNTGYTVGWLAARTSDSQPGGQAWSKKRMDAGDIICINNQRFRGQNLDVGAISATHPYYPSELGIGDSLAPRTFVNKINVPVFLAGAWQDEQTGSHFATMLDQFTGTTKKHFMLINGAHAESIATPDILARWLEFLQFYVAHKIPDGSTLRSIGPLITPNVIGGPSPAPVTFPADRFTKYSSYAAALAAYEAEPEVRVYFDNGSAPGVAAGLPVAGFVDEFPSWPIPTIVPTTYYLGNDGTLTTTPSAAADDSANTIDSYVSDPSARPASSLPGGDGVWNQLPNWQWTPVVDGKSLSFATSPLAADTVLAGTASANLWLRSNATDTDLQVTLSEIRPDGKETYIQSGWLRASERKLDASQSTQLNPVPSQLQGDVQPLVPGNWVAVRVGIYPFAHAFRSGSRIRITITAPGGDRPVWEFGTLPGTQTNDIAHSVGRPSAIILPVVPGIAVPTPLPACPSLRGQACRTYVTPAAQP